MCFGFKKKKAKNKTLQSLFASVYSQHLLFSQSLIHLENEMRVEKEKPAYVSNKESHEQKRHTPSPVLIYTTWLSFSWGLSKLAQFDYTDVEDVQHSAV